jgi:drug/metabolite transporter (DMT)-like permease
MTTPRSQRTKIVLALAVTYVVWGSTYLGIRYAIETIPPFLMGGVRFLIAGGALLTFLALRGAPRPTLRQWRSAAIAGALLFVGGNGGVTWAEQWVPSGLAALVVATTPLWMLLIAWGAFGERRPRMPEAAGIALGLSGVGLLVLSGGGVSGSIHPPAAAALLLSSFSFAAGSIYTRTAPLPESRFQGAGMEMLAGGAMMVAIGFARGEAAGFDPAAVSTTSLVALVYLITIGALFAFSVYAWLLAAAPPALAGSYAFVNPVVAVLLGWAIASEPITPVALAAMAVIVAGVALITLAKDRPRKVERHGEAAGPVVPERACVECG